MSTDGDGAALGTAGFEIMAGIVATETAQRERQIAYDDYIRLTGIIPREPRFYQPMVPKGQSRLRYRASTEERNCGSDADTSCQTSSSSRSRLIPLPGHSGALFAFQEMLATAAW